MAGRSAIIHVMAQACYRVSRRLLRDFGEVEHLQVSRKGPADFVSAADLSAESRLVSELASARPDYGILREEGEPSESRDPKARRWIIDPLDGTLNFLHGLPHWAISIGMEEDGRVVAGVVYDPTRDELFWAEKGLGAYLNDRRIRVSERRRLTDCLIATGIPFSGQPHHGEFLAQLQAVMPEVAGVRRYGAASLDLAYVAAGRFDGYWENGLKPWDLAAGQILVQEAGGFVTDFSGRPNAMVSGDVLSCNPHIHRRLLRLIRSGPESGRDDRTLRLPGPAPRTGRAVSP